MEPIHILLVEDNEGDVLLTKEALEDSKINVNVSVAKDGKEAIDFLNKTGVYQDANIPDLLLLDVNLPKINGHGVLKYIKENLKLKHIPVVMLSTSSSENDINLAYQNHANCFITKPLEADDFIKLIASIESFWMTLVKLPVKIANANA